jgi:hypothetical protein
MRLWWLDVLYRTNPDPTRLDRNQVTFYHTKRLQDLSNAA